MKTKLLLAVCIIANCLLPIANSFSQTTFQKTFGGTSDDWGFSVQQTTDGGYIITGTITSFGAGGQDVYLIKTDAGGNSLWTKTFGGITYDVGNSVRQTTDGGYIIAGTTYSFGVGNYDVYLIKTDANGNTLWTKTFGGTSSDEGYSAQQTTDGGFVITGYTGSFGAGNADVYLIKTDANGNTLWTKTFGRTNSDLGYSVQQTTDGGYVIAGLTDSFGAGLYDVYLIKTNGSGDTLWTKTFGGIGIDYGLSAQQTTDGGYVIAGVTQSFGAGIDDVYLIKTDGNGDTLWTKIFGGTDIDEGYSVQQTTDGGFVITGYTGSFGAGNADVYLIKTDANGNSGCNEGNTNTIVTTPSTIVTSPSPQVSSGGIVGNTATQTGSGGVVTTLCTSVGINELNSEISVAVFPNPTTGIFTIQMVNGNTSTINHQPLTIEVYNVLGKLVFQTTVNRKQETVNCDLRSLPSGIYFYKLSAPSPSGEKPVLSLSNEGEVITGKLIIQ